MPYYKSLRSKKNEAHSLRTINNLLALRKRIAEKIPERTLRKTLLLATWNIRDFDSNKFNQGPRKAESYHYIAEIIAAFDIVALQEINEDLRPIKRIKSLLGSNWDFITTDVNSSSGGNSERLCFIFDKRKVYFRQVAGEIIIPKSDLAKGIETTIDLPKNHQIIIEEDVVYTNSEGNEMILKKGDIISLPKTSHKIKLPEGQNLIRKQLARTPFMVSFQSSWFKFNLCTVHILFGSGSIGYKRRVNEIKSISKHLAKKSKNHLEIYKTAEHFILLGDFNIISEDDDTFKALTKQKFTIPQGTYLTNENKDKAYDQIAFAPMDDKVKYTGKSGIFDMYQSIFKDEDESIYWDDMKNKKYRGDEVINLSSEKRSEYYQNYWRTFQISDHFPLWIELEIDFSDAYLENAKQEIENGIFVNPSE